MHGGSGGSMAAEAAVWRERARMHAGRARSKHMHAVFRI
jgi:hypothetical protein